MTLTTTANNLTIWVWFDKEWGVWMWLSDTDGGVCPP